ncbi:MAG: hemolysin family protein [Candidatus Marinimicrobia bacterium]|nr:hemolysin family protein [Candidatus Neomarinimicrobiota bacterium]
MIVEIILASIGLLLSAYFSGSEIAFISANPIQLQIWQAKGVHGSTLSIKFLENREKHLTAILVGNTIANILTTSFATVIFVQYNIFNSWQIIIIISLTILIFGEIIPKTLIREKPNGAIIFYSLTLQILEIGLLPITYLIQKVINTFLKLFKSEKSVLDIALTREEFNKNVQHGHISGVINKMEKEYINNVIDFSDKTAGEIDTPRTDVVALQESDSINQAKKLFIESGFSKILIYREDIDDIIGFVVLQDLLNYPDSLKDSIRKINIYPETQSIYEMLKDFQRKNISIALIVNEYGGTSGIITMEDLVEEIFGDFEDEYDSSNFLGIKQMANGDLLVNGRTEIDDLNKEYNIQLPDGDYETIGGYIIDEIQRFPVKDEKIILGDYEFIINKATDKNIGLVTIRENKFRRKIDKQKKVSIGKKY